MPFGSRSPQRAQVHKLYGPVALIHIDAHLDTWDTYFGAPHTHGTPFRRAAEERLFDSDCSVHIGIRGPLYSSLDLENDAKLGFCVIHCDEFTTKARGRRGGGQGLAAPAVTVRSAALTRRRRAWTTSRAA